MQVLKLSEYLCKLICNCSIFVGGIAYSSARFGAGTGPIFLDDVQCTSSSSQLLECSSRPILTHNCQHSEDAGVGCEGTLIYSTTCVEVYIAITAAVLLLISMYIL